MFPLVDESFQYYHARVVLRIWVFPHLILSHQEIAGMTYLRPRHTIRPHQVRLTSPFSFSFFFLTHYQLLIIFKNPQQNLSHQSHVKFVRHCAIWITVLSHCAIQMTWKGLSDIQSTILSHVYAQPILFLRLSSV